MASHVVGLTTGVVAEKSLSVSNKLQQRRENMEQLYKVQQLLRKLQAGGNAVETGGDNALPCAEGPALTMGRVLAVGLEHMAARPDTH